MVQKQIKTPFLKLLIFPILYEIILGGSGRMFEVGPVTLRMIFFVVALFLSIFYYGIFPNKDKTASNFLLLFIFVLLVGISVGMLNGAKIELILEDVKALIFFLIIIFFSIVIHSIKDIDKVISIVKKGSLVLGIIYLTIVMMLFTQRINFSSFYESQSKSGEILFRTEFLFFYKGFLYLCVGFFFFILKDGIWNKIGAALLYLCICLTLTRGFILFTTLILGYYVLFVNKRVFPKIIILVIGFLLFLYALPILYNEVGDKSESDSIRLMQINEVIENINPLSFFVGHGFGNGTELRPIHMEIAFLEIFQKQGVIGLLFWMVLLGYIFKNYLKLKNKYFKERALPFLLSTLFVYMQSFTNPFINNSIGMSITLISLIVINRLVIIEKTAK